MLPTSQKLRTANLPLLAVIAKRCHRPGASRAIATGITVALGTGVQPPRTCVYILRSKSDRTRYYTGVTSNWRARIDAHNDGRCSHTARYRPWEIDVLVQFTDERRARAFERYLKSGSGCAFAKRHLR